MEICSQDAELETTFQNWLGPKNESTYDLCKRLYNGLTDRVCRPPRKVYPDCEYEKEGWLPEECLERRPAVASRQIASVPRVCVSRFEV